MRPLQRFSVAGLILLFAAGAALVFYLNAGTRIQIQIDGHNLTVATHASTVGAALAEAGVGLSSADRVTPPLAAPVDPAVPIVVARAPLLSLAADGRTSLVTSTVTEVSQLPASLGLSLGPDDQVLGDGTPLAGAWPRSLEVRRAVEVTIHDGPAAPQVIRTAAATVGEALWTSDYQLYAGDSVVPGLDAPVAAGLTIQLTRSQVVTVHADGHDTQGRTHAATVGQALSELGLALVGEDYSTPAEGQPLPADGHIRVVRVREAVLTDQQLIPFDVTYQALPNVEIDHLQLVQAGAPGVQRKLTRVRYEDGVEVARVAETEAQVQTATPQIIGYGTNIVIRTLDTPDGPIEYWRALTMYATSYAAKFTNRTPGTSYYGRTASGKILTKGLVAIDRRLIPFGTRMYVPGYGPAEAADTGSGVKGRFIDLGFDDFNYENWHSAVTVYFLTPQPPADQIQWIMPSTVP
jgi:uncharacterized protein YabE (DUF348 family)